MHSLLILTTLAFFFVVTSFATSSSDESPSTTLLHDELLSWQEAAFSLAGVAYDDPATEEFFDSATALPSYCHVKRDYSCYKRGVPLCCIRSSMGCPDARPQCDDSGRQQSRSTDVIPAGGVCRSGMVCTNNDNCRPRDVCESGYFCSNGRCRARSHRIRNGGSRLAFTGFKK